MQLEPINDVLNRPTTKCGVDSRVFWLAPAAGVPVMFAGILRHAPGLGTAMALSVTACFIAVPAIGSLVDREFWRLAVQYLFSPSYFDPFV
jgi:hypothetical protein